MPLETKPETEFGTPKLSLAQQSGSFAGMRAFRPLTPRRLLLICLMLLAVLFVAVVIALRMGTYPISIREIVLTLFDGAIGRRAEIPSDYWLVVFGLRLPRIALGILVGAALSTAGAGYQALLRNPLADPYVLGVSSGAAVGAIISLIVTPRLPGAIQIAAFIGAVATISVVYFLVGAAGNWIARRCCWRES
jgi:iron complex transport system permease protein